MKWRQIFRCLILQTTFFFSSCALGASDLEKSLYHYFFQVPTRALMLFEEYSGEMEFRKTQEYLKKKTPKNYIIEPNLKEVVVDIRRRPGLLRLFFNYTVQDIIDGLRAVRPPNGIFN